MTANKKPAKPAQKPRKKPEPRTISANVEAIDEMIEALRTAGRLERVDTARIQIARRLAQAVDENPENVGLWQQYRAAESALREVGTNDDIDSLQELLRALDTAEMGDTKNRKQTNPRR